MYRKRHIVILSSLILSACGGGGGGSDPEFIKLEKQALSLSENTQSTISFSSSFDDLAFKVTEAKPVAVGAINVHSGQLLIAANETDRPGVISGVLYSQGKGVNHATSKAVSISIKNTSAKNLESQANNLSDQAEDILALNEDKAIYQFVIEASYLNGLLDYNQKTSLIDAFNAQNASTYSTLSAEMSSFESALNAYEKADISDQELASALDSTLTSVANHSSYAAEKLTEISSYSSPYFGDLTQTSMNYDPVSGRFSRYLGQEEYGAYAGEIWSFLADYQLLSSLVIKTVSGSIPVCEAK